MLLFLLILTPKSYYYVFNKLQTVKNYNQTVEINHNPNWSYIPDHPYRIIFIGGSGSGKTNVLLSLMKSQRPDIDKI